MKTLFLHPPSYDGFDGGAGRPRKIGEMLTEMMGNWDLARRRLREGVEFFRFLRAHEA